jgi:hypothetical protein
MVVMRVHWMEARRSWERVLIARLEVIVVGRRMEENGGEWRRMEENGGEWRSKVAVSSFGCED